MGRAQAAARSRGRSSIAATAGTSSGVVAIDEVDDALAGQTRHRGAADVLDDEVGSRCGISSATAAATSSARGSHGSTEAGVARTARSGSLTSGV